MIPTLIFKHTKNRIIFLVRSNTAKAYFLLVGEPFTEDEMKEMLGTCVYDDSSNVVQYKDFVSLLAVEET